MLERFLQWLTRDSAPLRQANAEIGWLRGEVHRLNDLLTQAWAASRIIPLQLEHATPPAPIDTQPRTMADLQSALDAQAEIDRERYENSEARRQEALKNVKEESIN